MCSPSGMYSSKGWSGDADADADIACSKFSCLKATAMVIGTVALFAGVEAALILSLRVSSSLYCVPKEAVPDSNHHRYRIITASPGLICSSE